MCVQEIIDFFEIEECYDKVNIIADIIAEIKDLNGNAIDEIGLEWDGKTLMVLDDFANIFYKEIIEKVCNVLKSFQNEA